MKKIVAALVLSSTILNFAYPYISFASGEEERYFVVTAYYSPLPNQNSYLRGDYEKEKILNGEGVKGASGKKVFSGMLAAPKGYDFGTKIYLDGVGIGSVEDRGGAIVKAGERGHKHDRIDIWVGYGDEGLKRALAWGKRVVKGKIVNSTETPSINLENFKLARFIGGSLAKSSTSLGPSIFYKSVGKDSTQLDIQELQKILSESGVYSGKVDGVYNSTLIKEIFLFQKKYNIISDDSDTGAGYWGRKTRQKFSSLYNSGFFSKTQKTPKVTEKQKENPSIFETYIHPNSSVEDIKKLQTILKEIGAYSGEVNGIYKDIYDIMVAYQIKNTIIKSKKDIAAGHFGPKTRVSLKAEYKKVVQKKEEEKKRKALVAKLEEESKNEAQKIIDALGTIKPGDTGKKVRELQIVLKDLGYFNFQDTGIYGNITKQSVIEYQMDNELIKSKNEAVAGLVGPNTRESLKEDIASQILEERLKEVDSQSEKQTELATNELE